MFSFVVLYDAHCVLQYDCIRETGCEEVDVRGHACYISHNANTSEFGDASWALTRDIVHLLRPI